MTLALSCPGSITSASSLRSSHLLTFPAPDSPLIIQHCDSSSLIIVRKAASAVAKMWGGTSTLFRWTYLRMVSLSYIFSHLYGFMTTSTLPM